MIVITLVLWMWKAEVLLTCSAILKTVGIAGVAGEGDSKPHVVLRLHPPCRVFPGVGEERRRGLREADIPAVPRSVPCE